MAIGAVARGDLVVVHSAVHGLHGLFVVDSVSGNQVLVFDPADPAALAGGAKSRAVPVDKTTAIFAVHTAASISA